MVCEWFQSSTGGIIEYGETNISKAWTNIRVSFRGKYILLKDASTRSILTKTTKDKRIIREFFSKVFIEKRSRINITVPPTYLTIKSINNTKLESIFKCIED